MVSVRRMRVGVAPLVVRRSPPARCSSRPWSRTGAGPRCTLPCPHSESEAVAGPGQAAAVCHVAYLPGPAFGRGAAQARALPRRRGSGCCRAASSAQSLSWQHEPGAAHAAVQRGVADLPACAVKVVVAESLPADHALCEVTLHACHGWQSTSVAQLPVKRYAQAGGLVADLPASQSNWLAQVPGFGTHTWLVRAAHLGVWVALACPGRRSPPWACRCRSQPRRSLPACAVGVRAAPVLEMSSHVCCCRVARLQGVVAVRVVVAGTRAEHALLLHRVARLVALAGLVARAARGDAARQNQDGKQSEECKRKAGAASQITTYDDGNSAPKS